MSETRRVRSLLRQSLSQHILHYYEELCKTNSEQDAKEIVVQEMNDLIDSFTDRKEADSVSFLSAMDALREEWLKKETDARKQEDYDTLLYAGEVLDAIKIVSLETKEREHGN